MNDEISAAPPERNQHAGPTVPRHKRSPLNLGGLTLKEFSRRLIHVVKEDELTNHAAALAYYFLFAMFPFTLFLSALLGFLPIPDLTERILTALDLALPREAMSMISDNVRELVENRSGGILSFGILASLWTASTAIVGITNTLNHAYNVEGTRPFWKVRLMGILLTIGFSIFIIASTVLLIFGSSIGAAIASHVGLGKVFEVAWNVLRWPVILILAMAAVAIVYYFCPDVEREWRWVTLGAIVAVSAWVVISIGFSAYVNNFGSYSTTYGSIGGIIMLMLWLYVGGFVILVGGAINAIVEHASAEGRYPGGRSV